jgi:sugar phosphate isomerase/epimerase
MKFAICNETFQGWDWARTCSFISALGYDGVEIAPFTLAEDVRSLTPGARRTIRQMAADAGLDIVGLHWLLVSPKGLSATTNEEPVRRETSDYLLALVDFCAELNGKVLVFGSPRQRTIPDGATREQTTARFLDTVRPALERAGRSGIAICFEPLPPPEADFLLTLAEARELVQQAAHPAARTIFDVKSASSEGRPLEDLVREFAPLIAHVHANDANRRGPGFGETDFRPVLRALRDAGYAGYVSVEVFDYSPDPETIARESLRYLRACL